MVEYCGAPYDHAQHMWREPDGTVLRCAGSEEDEDIDAYNRVSDDLDERGYHL